MQGTIVMLMALSGLGCHHKECAVAPAPACYDSCYAAPVVADCAPCGGTTSYVAPSCYSDCYASTYSGCYGGGYGSCFGGGYGSCYSAGYSIASDCGTPCAPRHKRGLFACLFGGHRRRVCDVVDPMPSVGCGDCYGGPYGASYAPAVFGSYTPVYGAPQGMGMSSQLPSTSAPATLEPAPTTTAAPTTPSPTTPPTPPSAGSLATPPPVDAPPPANPPPPGGCSGSAPGPGGPRCRGCPGRCQVS